MNSDIMKIIKMLEQGGLCQILLYLYENRVFGPDTAIMRSVYRSPPLKVSGTTIRSTLDLLFKEGLIDLKQSPNEVKHFLTPKGIRVAKSLKTVANELEK